MRGRSQVRFLVLWLKLWRWANPAHRRWVPLQVWWYLQPPIRLLAMVNAVKDQRFFRLRNDDGSETAATWLAAEDTNATMDTDKNYRVRFTLDDTANGGQANSRPQLAYNLAGAGWNNVSATSSVVRSSASTQFADGDDTTRQLTVPSGGSFITPNSGMDEVDGLTGQANDIDFVETVHDFVEVEYCFQIRSVDVTDGQLVELRIDNADTFTITPSVTINVPSIPLNGAVQAVAQGSGTPEQVHAVAVTVDAVGEASGVVEQVHALTGNVSSVASELGTLTQTHVLNGVVEAVAVATGTLTEVEALTGSVSAVASVTGVLTVTSEAAGILVHFATMVSA